MPGRVVAPHGPRRVGRAARHLHDPRQHALGCEVRPGQLDAVGHLEEAQEQRASDAQVPLLGRSPGVDLLVGLVVVLLGLWARDLDGGEAFGRRHGERCGRRSDMRVPHVEEIRKVLCACDMDVRFDAIGEGRPRGV